MIVLRNEPKIKHEEEKGFVVINKPPGPSSHEVTVWTKKILNEPKAGHSGTLDPNVTGVLPVAFGKGMKLLKFLSKADKEYVCLARFQNKVSFEEIKKILRTFTGKLYQTPPKESAVKKVLRTRVVHSNKLLEVDGKLALFRTKCQHGTYMRVLCKDIGEVLGNECEMIELRRVSAGGFSEEEAVTLQELKDSDDKTIFFQPISRAISNMKKVIVGNKAVSAVCHGAKLAKSGLVAVDEDITSGESVSLFTSSNDFIGVGEALMTTQRMVDCDKGFIVKPSTIVMDRGLYDRNW